MPKKTRKPQPYVVIVSGPGLAVEATLDGARGLSRLVETLASSLGSVGSAMSAEKFRATFSDHYETLGLRADATTQEIDEAYIQKIFPMLPTDALERAIQAATAEREKRHATTS